MQIDIYKEFFNNYFNSNEFKNSYKLAIDIIKESKRIFFIGNGGSNAISSHMAEDYQKMGKYPTFCFSDPALITCYSNDYGYENAITEWLKIHFNQDDILIAISSSGNSKNIINAVNLVNNINQQCITLSGFSNNNPLLKLGIENFHIPIENYGVVECFHEIILHSILDEIVSIDNK